MARAEKTVETLRKSRVRGRPKVLLGGRAINAGIVKRFRADAYAREAWDVKAKAKELMAFIKSETR